ncbi:MAG: glycosyltransferase family 4 protein [Methylotenera sp.]|uniref:glycosyltransferase family 4 protein n=1 Tax=Methylotenera sp. TaxID=2051956 RepID=UPI002718960C|nr:glycosyltransferase family 4 protein [Methylotenera sp.]MDO9150512.1 glycosyltransferase family 4 protein [Methylotenera sp.]
MKNIAIAADNPELYSQTFVRRHINELFSGRTVVVLTKNRTLSNIRKPIFIYAKPKGFFNKIKKIVSNLSIFIKNKPSLEDQFAEFLIANKVNFLIAEFGYVGLKVYNSISHLNIPMYCYFRGSDASQRLNDKKYIKNLQSMMPKISGIVAVSQSLINNLKQNGIHHPVTHVIPSGVDTHQFQPSIKDDSLLVAVGRFVEKKAPDITIKAFAATIKKFPNARLEMIGDGPMLPYCKTLAQELGIAASIIFHGSKEHAFVKNTLAKSSIFLQHSITAPNGDIEGLPTAIQEAMASGAVVISTNHSGIPEHIINNFNGLTVEEGDLSNYIEAINKVFEDADFRNTLAINARNYAEKHLDYRVNYEKLEQLITNEINKA